MGEGGSKRLYTKIQDNNDDGLFDIVWFYNGDNTDGGGGDYSQDLLTPFASARVTMCTDPNGDTMFVGIDRDFNGTVDETLSNTGILAFAAQLGNGYGIGAWAEAEYDNWQVIVPEPATLALLALGLPLLPKRKRRP